jgi:predicted RNase H-like HicB family nuclease
VVQDRSRFRHLAPLNGNYELSRQFVAKRCQTQNHRRAGTPGGSRQECLLYDRLRETQECRRCDRVSQMHNEFTSIIEQDGEWFVAYSPEIPGANGQGLSPDAARESLAEAIALILEDRREDGLRGVPQGCDPRHRSDSVKRRREWGSGRKWK